MTISVVIPIKNESNCLPHLLGLLSTQTLRPAEVIFIDADSTDGVAETIQSYLGKTSFSLSFNSVGPSYPGRSRNIGLNLAKGSWVAFMDMGIEFDSTWLERSLKRAQEKEVEIVFGCCDFSGATLFQKAVCALTYGLGSKHETVPGSVVKKDVLKAKKISFREDLRAGEDILWKKEVRSKMKWVNESLPTLHYKTFSSSLSQYAKKRSSYAKHEALAGFHVKHFILLLAWVLMPLLFLGLNEIDGLLAWIGFFFLLRGVIDPIRRSSKIEYSVLLLTPFIALVGDLFAIKGYFKSLFDRESADSV